MNILSWRMQILYKQKGIFLCFHRLHMDRAVKNGEKMLEQITHMCMKVSYLCNNRCGFCWQEHRGAGAEISAHMLEKVKEIVRLGNLKVVQMGGGEVFLWKPAKEFIQYLRHYNPEVKINLITNGSLFNDYWFAKAEEGLFCTINLSINGPDEGLYNRISVRKNFDKVINALRRLGEIKKRVPFYMQVSFVMTKPLLGSLHKYVELAAGYADVLYVREMRPNSYDSSFYLENRLDVYDRKKLVPELLKVRDLAASKGLKFDISQFALEHGEEPDLSSYYLTGYEKNFDSCPHMYHELQIHNDGLVRLGCNFSGITLGNLNEKNWDELFRHPRIFEVHSAEKKGDFLKCQGKLARFGCSYALRQIGSLSGVDRYIREMPDFVFPRESPSRMLSVMNLYCSMMTYCAEILKKEKICSSESGFGAFTPLLLNLSSEYKAFPPFADNKFIDEMNHYLEYNKIQHHRYSEKADIACLVFSVINSGTSPEVSANILSNTVEDGIVVLHLSTLHSREMYALLEYFTQSPEWGLVESFGVIGFIFKKNRNFTSPVSALLRAENELLSKGGKKLITCGGCGIFSEFFTLYVLLRLKKMKSEGFSRIALYGCGGHTEWLEKVFSAYRHCREILPQVTAVIDDKTEASKSFFGLVPSDLSSFDPDSADAVVFSSNIHQNVMRKNFVSAKGELLPLFDLYENFPDLSYDVTRSDISPLFFSFEE